MTDKELIEEHEAVNQAIEQVECFGTRDLLWEILIEKELRKRGYKSYTETKWHNPDKEEEGRIE